MNNSNTRVNQGTCRWKNKMVSHSRSVGLTLPASLTTRSPKNIGRVDSWPNNWKWTSELRAMLPYLTFIEAWLSSFYAPSWLIISQDSVSTNCINTGYLFSWWLILSPNGIEPLGIPFLNEEVLQVIEPVTGITTGITTGIAIGRINRC
jgi:hypothetical protein